MAEENKIKCDEKNNSVFTTCWEVTGCSRSDYISCPAFQQRKNCYELDRVICCTKHRDNCASCPVYIAINKVPVERTRVRVCTDRFDIEGDLHMPVGARLSDYINRTDKPFLVLTDAEITQIDNPNDATHDSVAIVNKSHIILTWPIKENPQSKAA
ncbi:MAG: hypothetical protein K6T99_10405 [Armatimonadetes bacterium]|nr:hypothetical protein [Armatimonadota bacterium]